MNWQHPSQCVDLASHAVHVWLFPLNCTPPYIKRFLPLLDDAEKDRSERFVNFVHRKRFIVSHGFMRSVLALYTGNPAESLQFTKAEHGKPYLSGHSDLHFNLSHSADMALMAISLQEVGVDIECMERKSEWQKIQHRFYTAEEQVKLLSLPMDEQKSAFYQVWSRKEAVMKVTGMGLHLSPTRFNVTVPPEPAAVMPSQAALTGIQMTDLSLPDFARHYRASLATQGRLATVASYLFC